MLVRQIRISLLPLLLLLASASVLAQAPRLTLSVGQGVQSGELRLVRRSSTSGNSVSLAPEGLAVSPDGRWLFNEGTNLEVWEIDSVRGIVTRRMSSASPGISRGLAVSQDSRFVFVPKPSTGADDGFITVWRLNANDGSLEKVAQYTEGGMDAAGDTVRGLISTWDVVPSPDGRLLFVTSNGGNSLGGALSVWSINTSGTLVQTDAHVSSGASDRRGLNQAAGAAVTPDGRLLFVGSNFSDEARSTLSIWRVNAEASTVSHVRTLSDPQLARPRAMALHPSGRLLFVMNRRADVYLSVYRVDAAEEDIESVGPGLMGETLEGIAATEEVLIAGGLSSADQIFLLRINEDDTVSLVSRQSAGGGRPFGVVASPAGGLVFANSNERADEERFITVWQVQGIPRVPAGQEVRVMVNAEPAPDSALTVMVEARQGSRVSTAAATLMPSDTQAEAVFSESALGQGEWIFSASVPADMADRADRTALSAARATLRIGGPLIRLSNLSGVILPEADLNIRVSTEGHPVLEDAEVTLRATQEGARRTVMGLLREGQTSFTVTFADENALTGGDWVLSAESSILQTDANSTLAVTVILPPLIRLSNLSGGIQQGADLNIRVNTEGHPVLQDEEVTLRATRDGARPRTVMGLLREGQTSVTVTFAGENALTEGDWVLSAVSSTLLRTDADSSLAVTVRPPPKLTLSVDQGAPSGDLSLVRISTASRTSRSREGFAVSPDGRWLFNAGSNLEVWEIDSVRGIVTRRTFSANPGSFHSRGLAVSQDSRFVFVPDHQSDRITVWRLNADEGKLEAVVQYREGTADAAGKAVSGLTDVWDVVPSPDGRLLFVTSGGGTGPQNSLGGALSVWSIDTSGILTQTDVHISSGASDTEGLNQAAGAAVTPDGRLLFVGSFYPGQQDQSTSTLSIWRVDAEASAVSFVRTLTDPQRLAQPRAMALGPSGSLLFVMNFLTDVHLSVYRVNAADENLESVGPGLMGETLDDITATEEVLIASASGESQISLLQINEDDTVSLVSRQSAGNTPFGVAASPAGGLVFANSSDGDFITVWQVLGIPRVPAGQEVRVMVSAEPAPDSALTVIVEARQGSRVRTAAATLMPSDTQAEAVFSGSALGQGEWIFSASVPTDMTDAVDVSAARATLRMGSPLIRLSNLSGAILQGAGLNIKVSTEGHPVLEDAEVTLQATLQEGTQPRTVTGLLREGQTSVTVTFADENALTVGDWILSAESSILSTDTNSVLAVTVLPPLLRLTLSLQETAEPEVPAGSTLAITVMADRPLTQTLTVAVQAVRTVTTPTTVTTATVTTQLFAGEEMGRVLFEGENALFPGQWVLTIAEVLPEASAEASPQELQVRVGPSALSLSAPMDLLQGEEAVIEVDTEVALGVEVRVMVTATHATTPTITASAATVLGPSTLAAEARFPANMLSLVREGTWNFEITAATPSVLITDTGEFPLVDFTETTVTLQVTAPAEPVLLLELPPQPVDPAQPVSIFLRKSTTISERLTVDITAMRQFGGMTLTKVATAVLSPADTTMAAVFGPGELSAGRWTLMASVSPPGTVPIIPPTATIMVRPPLLRLQRLGPASVAAGTRVTVRVAAEAMPEDEGLGVRVIARQAMRADVERSAVLGSGPDFSAGVDFTSLPPGEWLLTAEAERLDAFRTEGATDTVTVQPAVLTLTPVSERVPAGEPARLILGSVVPLGVAVNLNVVAELVSLSFLQQMTAVNLDEAATSAMVVYNPGELAPGIWNFSVQVTDAAVRMVADVSMATATLRIAAPLIRLSNLSGAILQGADLNIRVSTEGMVPVAGDAEVTLRATLQEGTQHRTVTGRLLEGQTSVTVTFAGGTALTEGDWTVSAETTSTLLQTDANLSSLTVIVGPQPRLLLELTGGTIVASDGTITLILRLMPALSTTVMVTVAVADEGSTILQQQQVALSSTLQLTFRASDLGTGRRLFTARGPAGVLEDSGAEVTVLVGVSAVLSANPEEDVFPGDEVRLSAEVLSGSDPAGISVILEVAVTAPDGSMRSNVLIPVSAETSMGGLTFIPDAVSGTWNFNVIESDVISTSITLTVVVAEVMPLPLDFNDPLDEVNADDLVLLLRYERLCAEGSSPPLPASCTDLGSEALAAGLAFESSPDRLGDLQNVRLPDVTGTDIGSVQTLTILLQALANVQDELLLPAAASSLPETTIAEAEQARDARLRIIRQLLGRE